MKLAQKRFVIPPLSSDRLQTDAERVELVNSIRSTLNSILFIIPYDMATLEYIVRQYLILFLLSKTKSALHKGWSTRVTTENMVCLYRSGSNRQTSALMDIQEHVVHLQHVLEYTNRTLDLLKYETEKLKKELNTTNNTVKELKSLIDNEVKK